MVLNTIVILLRYEIPLKDLNIGNLIVEFKTLIDS